MCRLRVDGYDDENDWKIPSDCPHESRDDVNGPTLSYLTHPKKNSVEKNRAIWLFFPCSNRGNFVVFHFSFGWSIVRGPCCCWIMGPVRPLLYNYGLFIWALPINRVAQFMSKAWKCRNKFTKGPSICCQVWLQPCS